ncbi:MAG: hypothetical protein E7262_01740 [Lachnospiraceae bacterium]|nr:hypothetical protein [Lachnospiraceae bacterium]
MIDNNRFEDVRDRICANDKIKMGIGTLSEKTVHSVLKHYYEPDIDYHEVIIGNYVADIYKDGKIKEIQTAAFNTMRSKLEYFLQEYEVTIIYPIPHIKWLNWINKDTKEVESRRKSPKKGTEYLAFKELYRIKQYLKHPNLKLKLVLIDIEEYRLLNGWSKDKKKGSVRYDRIPLKIETEINIECIEDYMQLVPIELPEQFTTKDYAKITKLPQQRACTALNILNYVGVIKRVGKKGNAYIYTVKY